MRGTQSTHGTVVEEEVRRLVAELELKGYDRRTAVRLLLDIADRSRSNPPKRPGRLLSTEGRMSLRA